MHQGRQCKVVVRNWMMLSILKLSINLILALWTLAPCTQVYVGAGGSLHKGLATGICVHPACCCMAVLQVPNLIIHRYIEVQGRITQNISRVLLAACQATEADSFTGIERLLRLSSKVERAHSPFNILLIHSFVIQQTCPGQTFCYAPPFVCAHVLLLLARYPRLSLSFSLSLCLSLSLSLLSLSACLCLSLCLSVCGCVWQGKCDFQLG